MSIVYIGVGSNLGERQENIDQARQLLKKKGINILRTAPLYETRALCKPGQVMPSFLNGVFEVETSFSPESLLETLEQIEQELGRTKKSDWSPRTIDLDILLYSDSILQSMVLSIPHPEMAKRWFVLKPLADLVPDMVHPVLGTTIKELLTMCPSPPRGRGKLRSL